MRRGSKLAIAGVAAATILGTGTGIALAARGGDDDANERDGGPITGQELEQATDAALAATGGGRVSETEVNDEESYYEVEVTLDNGDKVDVHLDEDFDVVDVEGDGAGGEDEGAEDD